MFVQFFWSTAQPVAVYQKVTFKITLVLKMPQLLYTNLSGNVYLQTVSYATFLTHDLHTCASNVASTQLHGVWCHKTFFFEYWLAHNHHVLSVTLLASATKKCDFTVLRWKPFNPKRRQSQLKTFKSPFYFVMYWKQVTSCKRSRFL